MSIRKFVDKLTEMYEEMAKDPSAGVSKREEYWKRRDRLLDRARSEAESPDVEQWLWEAYAGLGKAIDACFDACQDAARKKGWTIFDVMSLSLTLRERHRYPHAIRMLRGSLGERPQVVSWSKPDSPSRWAKVFRCSPATMTKRLKGGAIPNKRLSDRSYQIDLNAIPEGQRDRYR